MGKYLEPYFIAKLSFSWVSFIFTQNHLTPCPAHFVKVSKWNIINAARLEFWSDHLSPSWESIWNQILSYYELIWSDQNSSLAALIILHLETFTKSAREGVKWFWVKINLIQGPFPNYFLWYHLFWCFFLLPYHWFRFFCSVSYIHPPKSIWIV